MMCIFSICTRSASTVVNPNGAQPQFANLSLDDYRVLSAAAGLRATSPTVGTADPVTGFSLPCRRVCESADQRLIRDSVSLDGRPTPAVRPRPTKHLRLTVSTTSIPALLHPARHRKQSTCFPLATPRRNWMRKTWWSHSAGASGRPPIVRSIRELFALTKFFDAVNGTRARGIGSRHARYHQRHRTAGSWSAIAFMFRRRARLRRRLHFLHAS